MLRYIFKRLLHLVPILLGITFLSFSMMRLVGSDVITEKYDTAGVAVSKEVMDMERSRLGLDKPFITQYTDWLGNVVKGDMGKSFVSGRNVFESFKEKLPATLLLAATSILLTVVFSIPLGIIAAVNQNKLLDYLIRGLSFLGNSMPNFFVSLVLMYFISIRLGLLPVISSSMTVKSAVLPAMTLAIAMSSKYLRQIRATVLDELGKEYVIGEKSRGIPFRRTLFKSVLRVSLVTIITLLALSIGSLLGGTAIVESIFMWDGVGKLAVDAINMRDYPMIQAYVMWMAIIYVGINLVTDVLYSILDPRIRLTG